MIVEQGHAPNYFSLNLNTADDLPGEFEVVVNGKVMPEISGVKVEYHSDKRRIAITLHSRPEGPPEPMLAYTVEHSYQDGERSIAHFINRRQADTYWEQMSKAGQVICGSMRMIRLSDGKVVKTNFLPGSR